MITMIIGIRIGIIMTITLGTQAQAGAEDFWMYYSIEDVIYI